MSEVVEFPDSGFALADGVPKRLHGHIAAYLVAVFEAIGNGLGRTGDANGDAFQDVAVNAFGEGPPREANDP